MVNVVIPYYADGWRATVLVSFIYIFLGTSDDPLVLYFLFCVVIFDVEQCYYLLAYCYWMLFETMQYSCLVVKGQIDILSVCYYIDSMRIVSVG